MWTTSWKKLRAIHFCSACLWHVGMLRWLFNLSFFIGSLGCHFFALFVDFRNLIEKFETIRRRFQCILCSSFIWTPLLSVSVLQWNCLKTSWTLITHQIGARLCFPFLTERFCSTCLKSQTKLDFCPSLNKSKRRISETIFCICGISFIFFFLIIFSLIFYNI